MTAARHSASGTELGACGPIIALSVQDLNQWLWSPAPRLTQLKLIMWVELLLNEKLGIQTELGWTPRHQVFLHDAAFEKQRQKHYTEDVFSTGMTSPQGGKNSLSFNVHSSDGDTRFKWTNRFLVYVCNFNLTEEAGGIKCLKMFSVQRGRNEKKTEIQIQNQWENIFKFITAASF